MLRPALAALLGSAFAVLVHPIALERFNDLDPHTAPLYALGFVSGAAALIMLFAAACREPSRRGGHQPCCRGSERPTPPSCGSGVQPPRDPAGRFVKAKA